MLSTIIRLSLVYRGAVVATSFIVLAAAIYQLRSAQYDVFPEFAPPQVTVQTEAPGFTSEQVETLITTPIEQAVGGATGVIGMQSSSIQGLSAVQLIFDPKSDVYTDRQIIAEQLSAAANRLPAGVSPPILAPLTSSTNNVLGIGLTSDVLNLTELRTFADWQLRPRILNVAGVSEAESFGGTVRQIQIQVNPKALVKYGLTLDEVLNAARKANGVRGAGVIDTPKQRIMIVADNTASLIESIAQAPLIRGNNEALDLAITLGDVATVKESIETPFSAASIMGKPGVLIMVTSQYGANTLNVTQEVEKALEELQPLLKAKHITAWGDVIRPASFIERAIDSVTSALFLGACMVIATLFLFLHHWRAALISALAIPFSLAAAAATLSYFGVTLNTMTLGGLAIAVGLVVDDAVIDVENMLRRLRQSPDSTGNGYARMSKLWQASLEVRAPVVFATLAVILVSVPIITLPGLAGRFFAPLGIAYALATLFSLLVAVTLTPALCMMFLQSKKDQLPWLTAMLQRHYVGLLKRCYRSPGLLILTVLVLFILSAFSVATFQVKFLPSLHEGHLIVHMEMEPGTSLEESIRYGNEVTKTLRGMPEVDSVVQQVGRTEGGIDVWGTNISEFNVGLKLKAGEDEKTAIANIESQLESMKEAEFEVNTFLTERVEEVISGRTSDAVLNIYGRDIDQLDHTAADIIALLKTMPDIKNVIQLAEPGMPELQITLKPEALHRYGLSSVEVLDAIHTAYQGEVATQLYDSLQTVNVAVILNEQNRVAPDQLSTLPIHTPSGDFIPLGQLADLKMGEGRYLIAHEGGQRVQSIMFDIRGNHDLKTLADVKQKIAEAKVIPTGSYLSVVSLIEETDEARIHLAVHSVLAGIAVFILLSLILRHRSQLLLVLGTIPFALCGGVLAVWLGDRMLSLGALVGFLTLLGITLRNSVLLISHYDYIVTHEGHPWNIQTALLGASERLLPILMTAIVTGIGLLPLALGSGEPGKEIEGPMGIVIIGGLISSTLLNLIALPLLASYFGTFGQQKGMI